MAVNVGLRRCIETKLLLLFFQHGGEKFSGNEIKPCKGLHREELEEERVHLNILKPLYRSRERLEFALEDL